MEHRLKKKIIIECSLDKDEIEKLSNGEVFRHTIHSDVLANQLECCYMDGDIREFIKVEFEVEVRIKG